MIDKDLIKKLDMRDKAVWIATWGGAGLIKSAPGTWGTLAALPFGLLFMIVGGWPLLCVMTAIVFYAGYHAAKTFEAMTGEHDAGAIVVDEVVGMWIALIVTPLSLTGVLAAFLAFRFFDILKPWPVSVFDRMDGPMGVMMDDVMAGIYAALCVGGLAYAGFV